MCPVSAQVPEVPISQPAAAACESLAQDETQDVTAAGQGESPAKDGAQDVRRQALQLDAAKQVASWMMSALA